MSNFIVFEGWDINRTEFVKREDLDTQRKYEERIDSDLHKLLSTLNLKVTKVPIVNSSRSAYQVNGVDLEVAPIHTFVPRTTKIERMLAEMSKVFGKCHHLYMFLDPDLQPDIRILGTEDCDRNGSILCIRQDITLYYLKILNEINKKYNQNLNHDQIIVLDFRYAQFDSVTLKKGILSLLDKRGHDYANLLGIIAGIPKNINSERLDQTTYFFVENRYYKGPYDEVKKKLLDITKVQTSVSVMPMAILITKKSSELFSIQKPCINTPSLGTIRKIVTPELIYEQFNY